MGSLLDIISDEAGHQLRRADLVCQQYAQMKRDVSDLVTTTPSNANYALVSLEEMAMECNNLVLGEEVAVTVEEWLCLMQQSQKFATKQARKANLECRKARNGSTKKMLKNPLKRARKFATQAVKTAERMETSYDEVQDLVESYCCDDGNLASNSTLAQWLYELSDKLDDRIPPELLSAYGDSADPYGCTLEAISGYVDIKAFHEASPDNYIEGPEDCASLVL